MATKPSLGYEQQLYISTQNYTNPASLVCTTPVSGICALTANVSDAATLLGVPQALLAVLDTDQITAAGALTVTVTGKNQTGVTQTWTAIFRPPAYAQDQTFNFPIRFAAELIPATAGDTCQSITSATATGDAAWANAKILILGLPDPSVAANYIKIGTKVTLDLDPKIPMPTAIQDGRDMGKYIKAGEIDIGTCDLTVKEPTVADGLSRYRGKRVTGLIQEIKEDVLPTQNIFLCGLIITPKITVPEGKEPITLKGTGMYERYCSIPAH